MSRNFVTFLFDHFSSWVKANSLWTYQVNTGCCGDEVLNAYGCRYDLERFGALPQADPRQADLLIITGSISKKAQKELLNVYNRMPSPKYVMAVGACACGGGAFSKDWSYSSISGVGEIIPVDVFVPGCPPRPEAIMHGIISLQEKIRGRGTA